MRLNKKIISVLICGAIVLSGSFSSLAASQPEYKIPTKASSTSGTMKKIDNNQKSKVERSLVVPQALETRAQGEVMKFYYMELNPLVQDPNTGDVGYLPDVSVYVPSPFINNGGSGPYLTERYSPTQTSALYKKILSSGYDLIGWRGSVKFRFDYTAPVSWTFAVDKYPGTTQATPLPHNPYQTYIYTYNAEFSSDPTKTYAAEFSGNVKYKLNGSTLSNNFYSGVVFNAN